MARRKPSMHKWDESALPVWKVERTSKPGYVKVTCPRRDCGGVFWVRWIKWLRASDYMTRSCTFCFKVSKLPKETP